MSTASWNPVDSKFKALVHFIIEECKEPALLGSIRLNKTLWFSDVIAYKQYGRSISGASYVKRRRGPVPKVILKCIEELRADGAIAVREPQFEYDTRKFSSLKQADTDNVIPEHERAITRFVLDTLLGHTATEVSEMSHDMIWDLAREGEEIPLEATLAANPGTVSTEVRDWAERVVNR